MGLAEKLALDAHFEAQNQSIQPNTTATSTTTTTITGGSLLQDPVSPSSLITPFNLFNIDPSPSTDEDLPSYSELDLSTLLSPTLPTPTASTLHSLLTRIIHENQLDLFYQENSVTDLVHRLAAIDFARIAAAWRISLELAHSLAVLALYDVVLFCDDSGSMKEIERGSRIKDLKVILFGLEPRASSVARAFISVWLLSSEARVFYISVACLEPRV
ncbi:hypothetical protein BC829DRAFT_399925 [Chytridium lagenaria]|nr:hypothetical protein BC829DRAFT_399925 [Chytridium lagenaria]